MIAQLEICHARYLTTQTPSTPPPSTPPREPRAGAEHRLPQVVRRRLQALVRVRVNAR